MNIGRVELLVLGIVFIALGILLPIIPHFPDVIATVLWVLGVILVVVWIILLAVGAIARNV